jgi:glycosyltransferase involved in cell wall biosynthesis
MVGKVVFLDASSPVLYSAASLEDPDTKIGGAEITTIRIAGGLAPTHDVTVGQLTRPAARPLTEDGVRWTSLDQALTIGRTADHVVVLRRIEYGVIAKMRGRAKRVSVWYHDWVPDGSEDSGLVPRTRTRAKNAVRALLHLVFGIGIVAVSETHAKNISTAFQGSLLPRFLTRRLRPEVIYNPIAVTAPSPTEPVDIDKLIYCSAPWKGLGMVLAHFAHVRKKFPTLRLLVASPGYDRIDGGDMPEGVEYLGTLNQTELLAHISTSLCVFYPSNKVPETFGIVFLESHAVGTPVLAHGFGSALEFLSEEETLDATDGAAVEARLALWRSGGRPSPKLDDALRIESVLMRWDSFISSHRPRTAGTGAEGR